MNILPAIDLYNKCAVRLLHGDYQKMTVYSDNPLEIAKKFEDAGAQFIHIVDLEGAKLGTTPNIDVIAQIVNNTSLFCEVGGGIRDIETVEKYINIGVDRVIIGTAAVTDRAFLTEALARFGDKIAVGADFRDGYIAIKGWLDISEYTLEKFLSEMAELSVDNVIITDISKDGAMKGANLELYRELSKKYSLKITASGGVSSISDVAELRRADIYGAIIGKAYYVGAINLAEAIEVAK